ncbi:coil containing protein [Vibrio phage 1.291.O._10N.286.55.F6]|nr:coil containing protein [Vibrio phage 1.291.O._10N.286.55.F6]
MNEFKKQLVDLLEKNINTQELNDNFGCSTEFIAQGMIDSISESLRLAELAKRLPVDFKNKG